MGKTEYETVGKVVDAIRPQDRLNHYINGLLPLNRPVAEPETPSGDSIATFDSRDVRLHVMERDRSLIRLLLRLFLPAHIQPPRAAATASEEGMEDPSIVSSGQISLCSDPYMKTMSRPNALE
jgi:hypothetical protein